MIAFMKCFTGKTVPIVRIDDLRLDDCHFLKIDVEGMEKTVLAGAVDTIRRFRPILYVEDDRFEKSAELRAFLESLGPMRVDSVPW